MAYIPDNTLIEFGVDYYYPGRKLNLKYKWKNNKKYKFPFKYEVNGPEYLANFNDDNKVNELINLMRQNGFLVEVFNGNSHRLIGECEGQMALCFGHGKKIGISSNNDTYQGYHQGINNILFDYFDNFNKWSDAYRIPKTIDNNEILKILLNNQEENENLFDYDTYISSGINS